VSKARPIANSGELRGVSSALVAAGCAAGAWALGGGDVTRGAGAAAVCSGRASAALTGGRLASLGSTSLRSLPMAGASARGSLSPTGVWYSLAKRSTPSCENANTLTSTRSTWRRPMPRTSAWAPVAASAALTEGGS